MCNCNKGATAREPQRLRREPERRLATPVQRDVPPNPRREGGTTWNGPQRRSTGVNGPAE